jgi:hypothetical protein
MKATTVLAILFPFYVTVLAIPKPDPVAVPGPTPVLSARDKYCTNVSGGAQGCDSDPWNQQRLVTVNNGDTFGVSCTTDARVVNGQTTWDYVPGWGCYISAAWTDANCEGKLCCG